MLGNLLAGKETVRTGSGKKRKRNCKSWFWWSFVLCFAKTMGFLRPPHPLTNFEIQKYYQNEPRFNDVFQEIICLKNRGWDMCNKF